MITVHDTKSLYSKVFEIKHGLEKQVAVTGTGRGEFVIIEGLAQIHKAVHEIVKFDIVDSVICDDGYFMVTVSKPKRWGEIVGEVQRLIIRHAPSCET